MKVTFSQNYSNINYRARVSNPINMSNDIRKKIVSGQISKHFVPTPNDVIDMMIRALGNIKSADRVLEPSAGYGHIVDRLISKTSLRSSNIDVVEPVSDLREVLKNKGYSVVSYDILKYQPSFKYDKIIMNPPFDNGIDILHFLHCFKLLKSGGRLVAILPENDFIPKRQLGFEKWVKDWLGNGEKKEINEYLFELLNKTNSKTIKLGDVFRKSDVPDDVQTRLVIIQK